MICKILVSYGAAEGWKEGDIVEITNPDKLIAEGKVELYKKYEDLSNNTDSTTVGADTSKKKSRKTK